MDRKMCRGCCRSASSRTLLLGLTERGHDAAAFPSLSVRGGGGCRRVVDDSAGYRASVAPVAACRRRCCRAERGTLPSLPPLLLLLATAVVVAETATVGQRSRYRRQEGVNFAPHPPPPLSLEQQQAPSAFDSRRPPFTVPAAPATRSREQRASGGSGGADTVDLWPSYGSPAEHLAGSAKRSRRQLVERCATKISGTGYFLTPQYPQLVTDGGYTCFWQLSVVYAGQTVSLDLSDLQTSRDDDGQPGDCGDSYVAVADLSGHVVRYCSPQPRPVLVGENVYVWASGHAHASLGLRASFRSTFSSPDWNPTPPECGGRLQAGDAFATPRHPGAYPTTQTCFWAAAAAAGRRLSLVFDSFDVGRDATCESDYVTVWTSERGLMPRLCGNVIPANVSTGAYIFVFFSSDGADDGGSTGFRARFVTDGETGAYTPAEFTTVKTTTIGVGQLTVSGATSAQPWSSAEPQPATSALPANESPSASPAPSSSSQPTEPTGGVSSSGSSRSASSVLSTTAVASTSTNAGGGSSASPSSWGTTPLADGESRKTTSTTTATLTTVFANVSGVGASTEPPRPSASSSFYVSLTTTTTATLERTSATAAAGATTTSPLPASSSVAGTGSRPTIRSGQTLGDSASATTSPATVQPESEFSSSSSSSSSSPPPPRTTAPQPGGGSSTPQSDVSSSSTMPLSTVSATVEQRSASTAQQPPRTVPPMPEASAASSGASTMPTTTRRRCKLRQKSPAAVASQSTEAPPR